MALYNIYTNNKQFLKLLNSGDQADFTIVYEQLLWYAGTQTVSLPDDSDYEAVSKVCSYIAEGNSVDSLAYAKEIIDNAIRDIRRRQARGNKLVSFIVSTKDIKAFVDIYSGNYDEETGEYIRTERPAQGWQGYYRVDAHGLPDNRVYGLKDGKERQVCNMYWWEGKKQCEIAKELDIDKGYVSRIIKRRKASPKPDTKDRLISGRYEEGEPVGKQSCGKCVQAN